MSSPGNKATSKNNSLVQGSGEAARSSSSAQDHTHDLLASLTSDFSSGTMDNRTQDRPAFLSSFPHPDDFVEMGIMDSITLAKQKMSSDDSCYLEGGLEGKALSVQKEDEQAEDSDAYSYSVSSRGSGNCTRRNGVRRGYQEASDTTMKMTVPTKRHDGRSPKRYHSALAMTLSGDVSSSHESRPSPAPTAILSNDGPSADKLHPAPVPKQSNPRAA